MPYGFDLLQVDWLRTRAKHYVPSVYIKVPEVSSHNLVACVPWLRVRVGCAHSLASHPSWKPPRTFKLDVPPSLASVPIVMLLRPALLQSGSMIQSRTHCLRTHCLRYEANRGALTPKD